MLPRARRWDRIATDATNPQSAHIREDAMTAATLAGREAPAQPLSAIDVSDPAIYEQDTWRPLFARLRREAPVHYCAESRYGPYWSVTRYNDIMAVELDHATYSSQQGGIQVEDQPSRHEARQLHPHGPAASHGAAQDGRAGRRPQSPRELRGDDPGAHPRRARRPAPQRDLRLGRQGLDRAHRP